MAITSKTEDCNVGSCTRNCELSSWGAWSPCSQACTPDGPDGETGRQIRIKKVIVPIRADGKCPKATSKHRLDKQECNTQKCMGDEVCIAKQDLIIAIDASGSLREKGFNAVQAFAANITDKLKSKYFGTEAVKVGVILFGNGRLQRSGTVAPAKSLLNPMWSTDMAATKKTIMSLTWQKGFTNLAQVFVLARKMFAKTQRDDAQNALLVITDGLIPFFHVTEQKAQELKDSQAAEVLMAVISEGTVDKKVFKLAGPGPTNIVKIPGTFALSTNTEAFAAEVTATFCPFAISPSKELAQEENRGYVLVKKQGTPNGKCGTLEFMPNAVSHAACMQEAQENGANCFSYSEARVVYSQCRGHNITAGEVTWAKWKEHGEDPPCGDGSGSWLPNVYFDTYCQEPAGGAR